MINNSIPKNLLFVYGALLVFVMIVEMVTLTQLTISFILLLIFIFLLVLNFGGSRIGIIYENKFEFSKEKIPKDPVKVESHLEMKHSANRKALYGISLTLFCSLILMISALFL